MRTYKVHEDGGHGWLEVSKAEIMATPVAVTPYSYQDNKNVYLEEDCDKWRFLSYLESRRKIYIGNNLPQRRCPMRSMRSFSKGGTK
ncbi:MAG: hypothetical protein IPN19_12675 [Elusimicrobia bacterium]|nr:hypothetical protein [Elusimicrobiota bacterium]